MVLKLIIIILLFVIFTNHTKENFLFNKKEDNNNCYSYSFDNIKMTYKSKPQPGSYSNIPKVKRNNKDYKCINFIKRVLRDYPSARFISVSDYKNNKRCNSNENTIFLALDNKGKSIDYHFYKQLPSGFWGHKPGLNEIEYVDDSNKLIKNPLYADRDYENGSTDKNVYNYSMSCGFFCNKK